jgi:hypothetical protein
MPKRIRTQFMPVTKIAARRESARRLPRQADHFRNLLNHMLNVKNEEELRRALRAHFSRLQRYYQGFLTASMNVNTAGGEGLADEE